MKTLILLLMLSCSSITTINEKLTISKNTTHLTPNGLEITYIERKLDKKNNNVFILSIKSFEDVGWVYLYPSKKMSQARWRDYNIFLLGYNMTNQTISVQITN